MVTGLVRWTSILATLIFLAACATVPVADDLEPVPTAAQTTTSEVYKLGSGDRLRITVAGEQALSGEFQVDGNGLVSLQYIGEVDALGLTVREFQREVEARYRDGYLIEPRVSAEVINFRPFYILGEVTRPGEYPYTEGLTVMNAIATAEGFSYRANKRTVFIRGADETAERAVRLSPTTPVRPGDTIRIGERLF